MLISVIVPNHNRDISKLKESLPESVELIEVNLGLERSEQRNLGIRKAKGQYLLILDSDQSIEQGLIDECVDLMMQGNYAVYIPEIIVVKSFFGKIRAFERTFYTGTAVDVPRFVDAQFCPEFNTELNGPEDAEWGSRIRGYKAISKHCLYHHDDISFWEYCKKKAYYSKSMKRYAELCPDDKCLNLKYRCWTVFTENGKWKELVKHPILTMGIIFVLAIRGVIYYANR